MSVSLREHHLRHGPYLRRRREATLRRLVAARDREPFDADEFRRLNSRAERYLYMGEESTQRWRDLWAQRQREAP